MDEITQTLKELKKLIKTIPATIKDIPGAERDQKPSPGKWSKKEILGHLVDSAFNNVQRLIRVRYEPGVQIIYDQDEWVRVNNYQSLKMKEVLKMWVVYNKQFLRLAESIPEVMLENTINTGKNKEQQHTARFLITDYLVHMQHHLKQIL